MDENKNINNTNHEPEDPKDQIPAGEAIGEQGAGEGEGQEHGCCNQTRENCCGGCQDENKESDKKDRQASFMAELNDLVQKYGGSVIGHGVHMMGEGPMTPSGLPLCLNSSTCEHASECPYGHPIEQGNDHKEEFSILLGAMEAISKRLEKIEEAVKPVNVHGCAGELRVGKLKSPKLKLRKKDIKRLRKAIVGEMKPYIRRISDQQTEELKSFINKTDTNLRGFINRISSGNVFKMLQANKPANISGIQLPQQDWTIEDWIKFQTDISQKILSSKMEVHH